LDRQRLCGRQGGQRRSSYREKEERVPSVIVNRQPRNVDVSPDTPLLWVLRDTLGLTGTKFGRGIAQ
jgi:hypothetical protein